MSATNRSDVRRADDFYSTPEWCVDALGTVFSFGPSCLDPCAGTGAIMRAVAKTYTMAMGLELDQARADQCGASCCDALERQHWPDVYSIVTNPPYSLAMEFVTKALQQECDGGVAMLLRLSWLASRERREFHLGHRADVYVLSKRPSFVMDLKWKHSRCPVIIQDLKNKPRCEMESGHVGGCMKLGTDAAEYAWFVWGGSLGGGHWRLL